MMRAVINLNILQIQLHISDRCKMEMIISIDSIELRSYKFINQIVRKFGYNEYSKIKRVSNIIIILVHTSMRKFFSWDSPIHAADCKLDLLTLLLSLKMHVISFFLKSNHWILGKNLKKSCGSSEMLLLLRYIWVNFGEVVGFSTEVGASFSPDTFT